MIGRWVEKLRQSGLEYAAKRYYSNYVGKVLNNEDHQQQGRVRLSCGALGTGEDDDLQQWATPITPYAGTNFGFYFPPEKNTAVWVWFGAGDPGAPRYAGQFFGNRSRTAERTAATSDVPVEFRNDAYPNLVTRRGIKTKRGHGLIFEDDPDTSHVEIWTGEQLVAGTTDPAERHNRIRLDDAVGAGPLPEIDAGEQIVVRSRNGHMTRWSYRAGEVFVRTTTALGHRVSLNDTERRVLIVSADGHAVELNDADQFLEILSKGLHQIKMDDRTKQLHIESIDGHSITIDDVAKTITVTTLAGQKLVLDQTTLTNTLQTPAGQIVSQAPSGTTVSDPGLVTVQAAGALSLAGSGVTIQSNGGGVLNNTGTGTSNNSFDGAVTENYNGALSMTINGLLSITNTMFSILGSAVGLGPAPRFRLVDERFFVAFLAHTHSTTIAGAPTGPPITGIPAPGVHTTTNTTAS